MKSFKYKLLVTDLDDTIWDWIKMWYNTFEPYLYDIQKITNIEIALLKESFKRLHQKYGTSEVSYAFKELDVLNQSQINLLVNADILKEYNSNRKHNISLYKGVINVLYELKHHFGLKIIGFTESSDFYTRFRIKTLELDGVIDSIYTPQSHNLPESVRRYYSKEYWELTETKVIKLKKKFKKPDPQILLTIVKENGYQIENTLYVGDKLDRDILMANQAGITSIHANYGNNIFTNEYSLLKEVTHWTTEEVIREENFKKRIKECKTNPDYTINNFQQILDIIREEE